MENGKEFFRALQNNLGPLSQMELLKTPIRQVDDERKEFDEKDPSLTLQICGFPVLVLGSLILWKLVIPGAVADALCAIPGVSLLTSPFCWRAKWYLCLLFHLFLDGVLAFVGIKKLYRALDKKGTKRLQELESRKQTLLQQYKERELSLGPALQTLPGYYRNYETVAALVGVYNLGYAEDLQTALACYETHLPEVEKLLEAANMDINARQDLAGSAYHAANFATPLWMMNRAYDRYVVNKEFSM